jgi:predicted membrane-bound mannosyltransferase
MPEAGKSEHRRIWVIGRDAKHKVAALEKQERREIRKARLFGAAIALAAAAVVLAAIFVFRHHY